MPRDARGFWVRVCIVVFYSVTWLVGRRRFVGLEHVPAEGPGLLVCNHLSHFDPLYTGVFVHRRGRIPRFLAKASLWKVPVLGRALAGAQQIPVYRDSVDARQSLRAAEQALDEGKLVLIYPEGTLTHDPAHWPMRARTGIARLALARDVPVVPTAHWGTHRINDYRTRLFRPLPRKQVVVRAGEPVDLSAYRGRPVDNVLLREVTDLVMGRVRDLLGEVREEAAPAGFYPTGSHRDGKHPS
ncbi:MAG TPA: lysophospholipid acyltransferase family protein [Pseudonocardiaceae bacterium]|nr:lysophospholipid acyltransferase family protein [Pseudonocardiaceae bacterium]